ncbi:MAG TPA: hypothetical protein PKO44_03020 [Candidatus Omnitrophota bacterium]|nr:hypothetical protein [Candidatus Omnitrophota bacterium]
MRRMLIGKMFDSAGQTAIEYMLLLTICALIVFAAFKTFFAPGGNVNKPTEAYFNKISSNIMGPEPVFTSNESTGGPCGAACTSFSYSDCPTANDCCSKHLEYSWQMNPNDPSIGAGQCNVSFSGCVFPPDPANCDTYSNNECCVQDSLCASSGTGCY